MSKQRRYIAGRIGHTDIVAINVTLDVALQLVPADIRSKARETMLRDPNALIHGDWGIFSADTPERRAMVMPTDVATPTPPSRPEVVAKAQAKRDRRAARLNAQFMPAPQ